MCSPFSMFSLLSRSFYQRKKMFSHLFYLYTSNALSTVFGLLLVLFLANFLTPTEYGNYKYIYSMVGILSVLNLAGGLRQTIIQSVAKGFDGILNHLITHNFILNIPTLVGGMIVGAYYLVQNNQLLGITIPLVTIGTIIATNGVLASGYLIGRSMFKVLFIFQTILGIINVGVFILAFYLFGSVGVAIGATSVAIGLTSLSLFLYIKRRWQRTDESHEEISNYGKHLNILSVFSTIQQHIDSILIFGSLGSTSLALYAIATPFGDRLLGFVKATYLYVLPKFTASGPEKALNQLYKRMSVCFLLGLGVVGIYYLCAPYLFRFLFPQYLEAIPLSVLFALNIPLAALTLVPQAYIDSLIEIRNKYIINGLQFSLRIITLPLGIYWFGVEGVIYSELFTRLVGVLIIVALIERSRQRLSAE